MKFTFDDALISFSEEALVGFVLDHLLILMVQNQPNCDMLLEIIRRAIYVS